MSDILQIKDLTLGYKGGKILSQGLNISCSEGQFVALVGRNGIGKSTLLRVLSGLARPLGGSVIISGRDIISLTSEELSRQVSFVSTESISVAHLKVWDVISMGRAPYTGWMGTLSAQDEAVAMESLSMVGMSDFKDRNINSLSDGERARVMIGRALAQDTRIMLLDEPTAYLDLPNRYQTAILLKKLAHQTGKTIIFSTHDLGTALDLCDNMWVMSQNGIEVGQPSQIKTGKALDPIFVGTAIYMDPLSGTIKLRE